MSLGLDGAEGDPDLDLIFSLALLENSRDDPEVLGALWQIDPPNVSELKDQLGRRHDFVLKRRPPWLHQEVRDTVRLFLLNPDQRVKVRAACERAEQILRGRHARLGITTVEGQLASDQWRTTTAALLWYTLWQDDREGLRLLAHLLPASMLLHPELSRQLLTTAGWFAQIFPKELQLVVAGLQVLIPASPFLGRLRTFFETTDHSSIASMSHGRLSAASEALQQGCSYPEPVLATDIPSTMFLNMLRARYSRQLRSRFSVSTGSAYPN